MIDIALAISRHGLQCPSAPSKIYNMKEIILTQNKVAFVDDEDFERLNKYIWFAAKQYGTVYYAIRHSYNNSRRVTIYMHREILNIEFGNKLRVDHKNHNGLDNQKYNLRIATISQNGMNRVIQTGSSKYKGVTWDKYPKKWKAYIQKNGRSKHLGLFDNEIEAAQIYDKKAKELFGEFANLNFKE